MPHIEEKAFSILALSLTLLVFMVGSAGKAHALSQEELEKRLRITMSCSAYASVRTSEYPEAHKVYVQKQTPNNQEEADKARQGLIWTNRAFYASAALAAPVWKEIHGRMPTNGELNKERAPWLKTLIDIDEHSREMIGANCTPLFDQADKVCSKKKCVARP